VRELDGRGLAEGAHLNDGDQVEVKAGEVGEVVAGQPLAADVGVDEADTAKKRAPGAMAAEVGQLEALGVTDDNLLDAAPAVNNEADLSIEIARDHRQLLREVA